MKDLFGNEITLADLSPRPKTIIGRRLGRYNYRKSSDPVRRCKTCVNCVVCEYHEKRYYKCRIVGLSHGSATDIHATWICDAWSARLEE